MYVNSQKDVMRDTDEVKGGERRNLMGQGIKPMLVRWGSCAKMIIQVAFILSFQAIFSPLLPVDVTNTIYFTWNAISFLLYRKGTAPFLSVPMSLFLLPFCLKDTSILLPLAPLLTPANSCHNIPFTLLSLPVYLTVPSETDFPEQRSHFISPLILHRCYCASFIDVW